MAKKGLGKGLSALIPTLTEEKGLKVKEIEVSEVKPNPNQPRQQFDGEAFKELVESVKKMGVIQPIVVRSKGFEYELIAGERRWRAAKEAGLKTIPAVIKQADEADSLEMALVENLHREDLNAIEEARAYQELVTRFGLTQEELAEKIGKSRSAVANSLRLLSLPPAVQQLLADGELTAGHARAILAVKDEEKQLRLAEKIISEGLSVREAEKQAQLLNLPPTQTKKEQPEDLKLVVRTLRRFFKVPVRARQTLKKVKVELIFKSIAELEEFCQRVTSEDLQGNS